MKKIDRIICLIMHSAVLVSMLLACLLDPRSPIRAEAFEPDTTIPSETLPEPTEIPTEAPTEAPTEPTIIIPWVDLSPAEPLFPEDTPAMAEARKDPTFLAKLLYAEAGNMGWKAQVYTCSAIINHCDYHKMSIWEGGHRKNHFSVAPYVDEKVPTETQYEVIEYVLNGGLIPEICYFKMNGYHTFGTPVCNVEEHYFSKP